MRWDCKYHVVFVPKYRQKRLYGKFRRRVGVLGSLRVELMVKERVNKIFWLAME
ncbi:MAG: hypothetical protein GY729_21110 [Desulfobacteraceae bacterium]|nr:hypothetical protein [Desulfobacteraceae bacterium]